MIWLGAGRLDKVRRDDRRVHARGAGRLCPGTATGCSPSSACSKAALAIRDAGSPRDVRACCRRTPGRAVVNAGAVMCHGVTDDTLARAAALLDDRSEPSA